MLTGVHVTQNATNVQYDEGNHNDNLQLLVYYIDQVGQSQRNPYVLQNKTENPVM